MSTRTKIRLAFLGLFILAILAALLDFPQYFNQTGWINKPFRLGLDLQGGTHLIYQADVSNIPAQDQASSLEGVRDVIERRVNAFGVAEPIVQTARAGDQWRIIVELAGITDVNEAIKMIGETPLLEFKTEPTGESKPELTEQEQRQIDVYNVEAKKRAKEVLNLVKQPNANFTELAKQYSEDPGSKDNGGELGFLERGTLVPEFEEMCFDKLQVGQIADELVKTDFGYHIISKIAEKGNGNDYQANCRHILIKTMGAADVKPPSALWEYTGLTGKQLKKARTPQVTLEFNDEGKDLFADITTANVGKKVAIFLDGYPISIPVVNEPITTGHAVITGNFSAQEAKILAQRLNAGALPVPIELISQQTIGATLGKISVEKSLQAGLIGLILVALFMIIVYRLPGILADLTLIFYGLILLALFKLIPVTLTLAGIAGFILSLGLAVDANVLIFERLKEELKTGKLLSQAIDEAFKRAWPSIRDGNISTLITCVILMWFSTSIVKGFAITLAIGILVSMFSSMVVTRILLKVFSGKSEKRKWLYGVKKTS
jgi:protein-export membrane protein SecD